MRSSKSRSRSKQNRNRSVGNVVNRVFDSSGPEGKVRGTPQQIIDKYNQLARDAQLSNDRVATENFQQHAEHYQRLLGQAMKEQEARREQQERENKERQAEREREKQEREAASETGLDKPDRFSGDLSGSEQPDVIGMPFVDEEHGLIETPETKDNAPEAAEKNKPAPKKPQTRRRRAPKKAEKHEASPDATAKEASSGSEKLSEADNTFAEAEASGSASTKAPETMQDGATTTDAS